ncbi:MAG: DJ-1/PfpI family protein [Thermoplasmata archaeon]
MSNFNVLLFEDFETLDALGPVEIIGNLSLFADERYDVEFYSEGGEITESSQGVKVDTQPISQIKETDILLIPGGSGVRREIDNPDMISHLKELAAEAGFVLTVCTGSVLLAKTGLLKDLKATSNKMVFDWVVEQDRDVQWVPEARWVKDGKFYTSSGVTAGMDMTLAFVRDNLGIKVAEEIADYIEYVWNKDSSVDPFYRGP